MDGHTQGQGQLQPTAQAATAGGDAFRAALLQQIIALQAQGASEQNSPEFARLVQVLRQSQQAAKSPITIPQAMKPAISSPAIHAQQIHNFQQQQQHQQHQHQQLRLQQMQQQQSQIHPQMHQHPPQQLQTQLHQQQLHGQLQQQLQRVSPVLHTNLLVPIRAGAPPDEAKPGAQSSSPPINEFTVEQRDALRNQIFAFKSLEAKTPIPENIKHAVFSSRYAHCDTSGRFIPSDVAAPHQKEKNRSNPNQAARQMSASTVPSPIPSSGGLQTTPSAAKSIQPPLVTPPSNPMIGTFTAQQMLPPQLPPNNSNLNGSSITTMRYPNHGGPAPAPPPAAVSAPPTAIVSPQKDSSHTSQKRVEQNTQNQASIYSGVKHPRAHHIIGVDPVFIAEDREQHIQKRIDERIADLEAHLESLGAPTPSESVLPPNDSIRIRAMIELKGLKLAELQRKVRRQFADTHIGLHGSSTLLTEIFDRDQFCKVRRIKDTKALERLEDEQWKERQKKWREKHIAFATEVVTHGRECLSYARNAENFWFKLGSNVLKFHATAEKEEELRIQQIQQDRLNALRANDEAAYLKLIDQAKDTRITQILNRTNDYLKNLSAKIGLQRKQVDGEDDQRELHGEDDEEASSKDYYAAAHRISETVTEQSTLLVGGKLKEYQIKGLQWMVSLYNNKLNGILADEMGLGKTIQTISLITYLIEKKKQAGPYLVIVPLGTITNWTLELEKWAPSVVKIVFKGNPSERKRLAFDIKQGKFNVLLTTYEYIINEKALLSKLKYIYMIIDEGHRMKNSNSKLSVTLMQHYNTRYRVLLTGTPLQNNLPELWSLLNFILPKVFNSIQSFDEFFSSPFSSGGVSGQAAAELTEEERLLMIKGLHKTLRPFLLRRLKKDVEAELPDKIETIIKCPMSAIQKKVTEWVKTYKTIGPFETKTTKTLNNIVMQFRKICNHPYVFPEVEKVIASPEVTQNMTTEMIIRSSGKFELLDRILPKLFRTGHRVLMFFQMTQVMDIIEDFFRFRDWKFLRMDGNIKSDSRGLLLKEFNDKDSDFNLFILSTRAGGLGLNLQTADTVIIFDSDWNPHQDLQAQDRAHRIGQTKEVRIFRLITTNSIEEHILAKAQQKLALDGKIIQAGKFDQKTSEKEREELLRHLFEKEDSKEDGEGDEESPEFTDEQLNEVLSRSPEEMQIFTEMDAERQRYDAATRAPPRLMTESELPPMYKVDLTKVKPVSLEELAITGSRGRKNVRYNDNLTEDQWTRAVDSGNLEQSIREKEESLVRRRKAAVYIDEEEDAMFGGDDIGDAEDIQIGAAIESRASRRDSSAAVSGKVAKKRPSEGGDSGRTKKAKVGPAVDALLPAVRNALHSVINESLRVARDQVADLEDGYYRSRSAIFEKLPSRKLYKDYYRIIRTPISFEEIEQRLKTNHYNDVSSFRADIILMFENARTYNQAGSDIVDDADTLQRVICETLDRLAPNGILPENKRAAQLESSEDAKVSRPQVEMPFERRQLPSMKIRKKEEEEGEIDE